jgi:hypothetical protein
MPASLPHTARLSLLLLPLPPPLSSCSMLPARRAAGQRQRAPEPPAASGASCAAAARRSTEAGARCALHRPGPCRRASPPTLHPHPTRKDVSAAAEDLQQHARVGRQLAQPPPALRHRAPRQRVAQLRQQDAADGRPQRQHACAARQLGPQLRVLVQEPPGGWGGGEGGRFQRLAACGWSPGAAICQHADWGPPQLSHLCLAPSQPTSTTSSCPLGSACSCPLGAACSAETDAASGLAQCLLS